MIRLVQTFGAHAGRTREFDQKVVTFGRLPSNDVAFDPHADLDASGAHAEIRQEGEAWVLVDSRSRNGTLIQGRVIQRHTLAHGDEIEFGTGGPRMRFEIVQQLAPQAAPQAARAMQTMPATPIEASPTAPRPEPKLYGQQTLDAAIEAAAARATAQPSASQGPAQAQAAAWQPPRGGTGMPSSQTPAPIPAPLPTPAYMANAGPPPIVVPANNPGSSSVWLIVGAVAGLGCLSLFCLFAAGVILYLTSSNGGF